jgi:CheY-like chemotaxis protein
MPAVPTKANILVLEDEQISAENMRTVLKAEGYRVITGYPEIFTNQAGFPDSIDQIITAESISLVLMDINLGSHLDGIDIVKHIRRQWEIPVIYVTGQQDTATILRARKTEPSAYLLKPFRLHQLKSQIQRALGNPPPEKTRNFFPGDED